MINNVKKRESLNRIGDKLLVVSLYDIQDVAEDLVEPIMRRPQVIRTDSMMLGYAGVYSSFLLHT